MVEGPGLRVLAEMPTALPKPEPPADLPEDLVERLGRERVTDMLTPTIPSEIDDVRMFAKKLVRLRTDLDFGPNREGGLDATLNWDWVDVEERCAKELGARWKVKSDPAGVIWLSKKASD